MTGRTPHRTPGERAPGRNPFEPRFEQLPETLPIFPLSGVLLLPGGKLPLNVFEPRYLAMIFDALACRPTTAGPRSTRSAARGAS